MNKRGQVFLMAALIIAGIVISLARVSNKSTAREEPEAFFDLSDEIEFEAKRVLDYGVINSPGAGNVGDLAEQLLGNYSENIGMEDVVFVYGDVNYIEAYYYRQMSVNAVSISGNTYVPLTLPKQTPAEAKAENGQAKVKIGRIEYVFDLKPGQNFYFVLTKKNDGEQFVAVK